MSCGNAVLKNKGVSDMYGNRLSGLGIQFPAGYEAIEIIQGGSRTVWTDVESSRNLRVQYG